MSDVLSGSPWLTLRAFLPPGALLRFRTTARYWNEGNKFGPYGDFLIFLLKSGGENTNTTPVKNSVSVSLWDLQATYVWNCITRMEAVLSGEAWVNVLRGLFPDDVVNLRVTAKCWNNGQLYRGPWRYFLHVIKNEAIHLLREWKRADEIAESCHGNHSSAWIGFHGR